MTTLVFVLSILSGVVLCATALSLFVGFRAHRLLADIDERAERAKAKKDEHAHDLNPLRETMDTLASQIRDLQSHPRVAVQAGIPKSGFNLSKRSQALRMHRRGEAVEKIASALELPRQEVELLLKVHRIVIQNL
jgi:hypothetical protein